MPDNVQSFGTQQPGANPSGSNVAVPTATSNATPAVGGGTNPFLPNFPSGQNNFPMNFAPAPSGSGGTDMSSINLANQFGFGPFGQGGQTAGVGGFPNEKDWIKSMGKAGFSAGNAGALWQFIQGGAGWNPQVAQAMQNSIQNQMNAMGQSFNASTQTIMNQAMPLRNRGEMDMMEQFGARGLRNSSAAAVGLGDYLSQFDTNLTSQLFQAQSNLMSQDAALQTQGMQTMVQMYEQAVSNFENVLLAGKGPPKQNMFQNIIQGVNAASGLISALHGFKTGGTSAQVPTG